MYEELRSSSQEFREWAVQAQLAQTIRVEDKGKVETKTETLIAAGGYGSDDPHVLALAQMSGARLLYSNDKELRNDFKNRKLIHSPNGKVYSTLITKNFKRSHRELLARTVCCLPTA